MVFPNSYCEHVEAVTPMDEGELGGASSYNEHTGSWHYAWAFFGVHIYSYPATLQMKWDLSENRELSHNTSGHDAYTGYFKIKDENEICSPSHETHDFEVPEHQTLSESGHLSITWDEKPEEDHTEVTIKVQIDGGTSSSEMFVVFFHGDPTP